MTIAKNQNTFAKRQREAEKRAKAEEKRLRRLQRKSGEGELEDEDKGPDLNAPDLDGLF
ncbi:nucleolar 14 family protein [Planctomicrobium sp.]|jgi:hypothetical protein|nr:nucleolar 14 family protein [Planctomicrobium sp.]